MANSYQKKTNTTEYTAYFYVEEDEDEVYSLPSSIMTEGMFNHLKVIELWFEPKQKNQFENPPF